MPYLLAIFTPDKDISPIIDCFEKFDVPFEVQPTLEELVPFAESYGAQLGLNAENKEEIESFPDVPGQALPTEAQTISYTQLKKFDAPFEVQPTFEDLAPLTENDAAQQILNTEIKDEIESFPDLYGHSLISEDTPICDNQLVDNVESYGNSFNAHVVLSNETLAEEEVEDVKEEVMTDLPFIWRDNPDPQEIYDLMGESEENDEAESQMNEYIYEQRCPVSGCLEKFFTRKDLCNHMNKHAKPLLCAVCEYVSPHGSCLRTHFRTHSGEKPFSCHICGKRFSQQGNLKTHLLRPHTAGEGLEPRIEKSRQCVKRPFICPICDKEFRNSLILAKHLRMHTGEIQYECEQCGYKVSSYYHLKKHKQEHSEEMPYVCTGCGFKTTHLSAFLQHKARFSH